MLSSVNYLGILFVHLAALCIVVVLWRHAPDVVQKVFLVVTFAAMSVYVLCDVLTVYGVSEHRPLFGIDKVWPVRVIASSMAHGALLVYLVRQWWIKTEACKTLKERQL